VLNTVKGAEQAFLFGIDHTPQLAMLQVCIFSFL
jgi:hypothetical protein